MKMNIIAFTTRKYQVQSFFNSTFERRWLQVGYQGLSATVPVA
jgi:hypothetical protein